MTTTAWYFFVPFLALAVSCAVWNVAAGLRRRCLDVASVVAFLASGGALYLILPYIFPTEPPTGADGFVLRYDIRTRTTWITPGLILLLVLTLSGALLFAAVQSYRERQWLQLALFVPAFALLLGGGGYLSAVFFREAWELVRAAERGEYEIVEGPVTDFELMRSRDRWSESFKVGDVPFRYHSGTVKFGFDRPAAEGGPIRPGLHVRIAHRGNVILRVETRE